MERLQDLSTGAPDGAIASSELVTLQNGLVDFKILWLPQYGVRTDHTISSWWNRHHFLNYFNALVRPILRSLDSIQKLHWRHLHHVLGHLRLSAIGVVLTRRNKSAYATSTLLLVKDLTHVYWVKVDLLKLLLLNFLGNDSFKRILVILKMIFFSKLHLYNLFIFNFFILL